ncbi:MAG: 4a-hydroxytetrahydrobiopterin dehydratase [Candidatus Hydrogenedentes bacterium]|nr:4a-hydroxytetrahydrobiopterin dehydratase [Candidatus Hydrogenedentota bacterium]
MEIGQTSFPEKDSCPILAEEKCEPCRGGVKPLEEGEIACLMGQLGRGWQVSAGHHLEKLFTFPDFRGALAFVNRAGSVAEAEGHHPELHLGWGKVRALVWTHKVDGLTRADFVLAAKLEKAFSAS